MGRKKTSSSLINYIIVLIALFAFLPKEIWVVLFVVAGFVIPVRLVSKQSKEPHKPDKDMNISEPRFVKVSYQVPISNSSFRIPSPPENLVQEARWIPAGESIDIAGYSIPGGLIYVGSKLPDKCGQQDPSLISPYAPVDRSGKLTESIMGYWPSYSEISPEARGAYLSWLSTGRSDPEADVGCVFLFFYGLERRILVDGPKVDAVEQELPVIRREVERLLGIYGKKSTSVQRYLSGFLQMISLRDFGEKLYEQPIPPLNTSYELPFYLKLALGQAAVDAVPIPPNLALAWAMHDPGISRRTPVSRCPDEFSKLFILKYKQYYHEGTKLPVNKTKLTFNYRAASSALAGVETAGKVFGNIPDVAAVMEPQKKLQKIVDECVSELDSYSRYIGRNSDKRLSIDALLLLPVVLWPENARFALESIKKEINGGYVILKVCELISKFSDNIDLSKDKFIALAKALESEYIGMEPDVISYPYALKSDDSVLIYFLQSEVPTIRATPEYQIAVLMLQLGSAVANSDGNIQGKETMYLNEQIDKWKHLSSYHLIRLKAYLSLLLKNPVTPISLKKKLKNISVENRETIISFITNIAIADGEVIPEEITFLEKIYKIFEVDVAGLYKFLHNSKSYNASSNSTITKMSSKIVLDHYRIEILRQDTENVSALLSDIFTEKAEEPSKIIEIEDSRKDSMLGLDDIHAAFLRILMTKSVWDRQELMDIANDLDLMVDGAIETINEASFKDHGQAMIEGEDPIEINMYLSEKILI